MNGCFFTLSETLPFPQQWRVGLSLKLGSVYFYQLENRGSHEEKSMKKVEDGNYVKVHYTGKFGDGEIFDSSSGCQPIEVHMGAHDVIAGFEDALLGMNLNEKKTFTLEAAEAYGEREEGLQQTFNRSDFPPDFDAEVGQVIILQDPEQGQFPAMVKTLEADQVVLDLNHPLAGRALTFDVEVVEINDQPSASACGCGCSCS
jgi:peptidylprolyl isomerase